MTVLLRAQSAWKMSVYWKAVQERLRERPKPRFELVRELCPKAMSKRKTFLENSRRDFLAHSLLRALFR